MITTGAETDPGINGGIMLRRGPAPIEGQSVSSYICTIEVASVDKYGDKVAKAGGSVTVPKMPVQGVGWLMYCKDTEGNIFGMLQSDENAGR
jgi:predicted enzyme related to lactoylglutathione lyase